MLLRERVENRELRLDLAAHYGAITDLHPGVGCKLIRLTRHAVEKFAHDVAAPKHEVSGE
jgi:hypothetical protein